MGNTRRLMIIDDDPEDKELFKIAAVELDPALQFITAANGEDALRSLRVMKENYPDIIFLDMNMPRLNGKQCLAEIKKMPKLKHVPVVMFSTSQHAQDIYETRKLGASYYLAKPNSFKDLQSALGNLLNEFVYSRKKGMTAEG